MTAWESRRPATLEAALGDIYDRLEELEARLHVEPVLDRDDAGEQDVDAARDVLQGAVHFLEDSKLLLDVHTERLRLLAGEFRELRDYNVKRLGHESSRASVGSTPEGTAAAGSVSLDPAAPSGRAEQ